MNKRLLVPLLATLATACGVDRPLGAPDLTGTASSPSFSAVKFWDAGATVAWNAHATALASVRVIDAIRLYTYLSLAQFRAAEAAQAAPEPHPPIAAAIGGASVAVLSSFFPLDVAAIEAALDAQEAADPWPGAKHADFAAGEAIGRAIGARVLVFASSDRFGLTNPLLAPVGPPPTTSGSWIYSGGPIARGGLGARPFFLTSADQVRPPPPPAFGSAAYLAALAEVKQISLTRTAEQIAIANYWNVNQSPRSSAAPMAIARDLIVTYRRGDAEAARIMFLMAAAGFDGSIGCFHAKYHYWLIRPAQADASIATVFPTPPHPSYPSAHSCGAGAMLGVLAGEFPSEATRLEAVAVESGLSRVYAGIHYWFDAEAGLALGRAVANIARNADLDRVALLP